MPTPEEVEDSPTGWVGEHVRRYVESGGRNGHSYYGNDSLLLTTLGRTSGKWRRTALIYGRDGDRYVVVGSNGGLPDHPHWYFNLLEHPEVHVQVMADEFTARARPATDEERPRLWESMVSVFPQYAVYQEKTDRRIPVVVLEPLA